MTQVAEGRVLHGQRALWRIESPAPAELRAALGNVSAMLAHLLYVRGYRTVEEIEGFFTSLPVSHDPFALPDIGPAVDRIARAVRSEEQVAVYGDFDCDGISSAAIMMETLSGLGLHPLPHIPEREDGHGLRPVALASLRDRGVTLVITADCGIGAIDEVRVARDLGMDVIVTDHHEPRADGSLPDCPTVAPTRHDSRYPWRYLCGAGVVYKLAQAIEVTVPGAPPADGLLDLVALGTVADVVPLRDENRALVIRGLDRLRDTTRPGLLALFQAAGVERRLVDPVSVAFYLAPRINAANRMASPRLAFELMTATDPFRARDLASELSRHNEDRQMLVERRFQQIALELGDAATMAEEVEAGTRPAILLVRGDWPAGISGLLASRLVETYGLPAFVGADQPGGIVSVSARGVPGMNVDQLLEMTDSAVPEGLFLGHGGHSRAGGFRVAENRFGLAREALEEQARTHLALEHIGAVLHVDAEVGVAQLTFDAARRIRTLAPFGMDFAEPLFLARGLILRRISPLGDGRHARFGFQAGGAWMDAIYFRADPALIELPLGSRVDVVFHLQLHEWNGSYKVQAGLRDWRPA